MRKPLIAGNWKMNLTIKEAEVLLSSLIPVAKDIAEKVDVAIAPSFVNLHYLSNILRGSDSNIRIIAQNFYYEKRGAFTGEVSLEMLESIGVKGSIVGHSERRTIFKEDDELINKKVIVGLESGFDVILCVGEHLVDRERGEHYDVVLKQLEKGLDSVSPEKLSKLVIAYEPIWAIGTGKTASSGDAQSMHKKIREFLLRKYDKTIADATRILYGGSVKPENIKELMEMGDIDGALVGGASLFAEQFVKLINYQR